MLSEIKKIPQKVLEIYEKNQGLQLPQKVYYLGLGPSYYACLVLRYCGKKIYPETVSEFHHYLNQNEKMSLGILISLDGDNRMLMDSRSFFYEYIAIVHHRSNSLLRGDQLLQSIDLDLPDNSFHSSLPYLGLLTALYQGLGLDCLQAIEYLRRDLDYYEAKGRLMAEEIDKFFRKNHSKSVYILGNGPNVATARQAAMILGRATPKPFIGMPLSHFDYMYPQLDPESLLIIINDNGPARELTAHFIDKMNRNETHCIFIEEIDLVWIYTPLNLILPFDFAAHYLSRQQRSDQVFSISL
jgi:hypothetical protein